MGALALAFGIFLIYESVDSYGFLLGEVIAAAGLILVIEISITPKGKL